MPDHTLIGRRLANFEVKHILGRGGMAEVYYGLDVTLHRPVAIKVIDARHRHNPTFAERFLREARTIALWRHENIIQIHYADQEDGLFYFAMEYIDGADLSTLMSRASSANEFLPHEEVLRIGKSVANALDYAHQQGVIHRDVKPGNVMVAQDGRVVLTDFGLALDIEQGSLGEVFGSSRYIAPEQARRSADAVPQSDLYSLGVILYKMLTGAVPFDDPSPTTVAVQHLMLPPPRPLDLNPDLNPKIEQVLLKALSKSPADRYQTGAELMAALATALDSRQIASTAQDLGDGDTLATAQTTLVGEGDSLAGQRIDEYQLVSLLGQGGMARVYLGLDVGLKRQVAIKVIDTPFRTKSDYIARFEREAQAIAQLDHPHIVSLYRYGEADRLLYMAMQYIEGADLEAVLSNYQANGELIEPEKTSRIIREICSAIDYAHSKKVIHRDLKPSNIMLDEQGRAIVTDFGLALLAEVGTKGEIFGSPHYIAPEQAISSANVVPQSDLYAIGIILYRMFTGQVPFNAEHPLDLAMQHMTEPPPSPRILQPEMSSALEQVLLKALAKEPEARYPSGAALVDALDEALQTAQITQSDLSAPKHVAEELAGYSLPLPPAAVVSPSSLQAEPRPALKPTAPPSPQKADAPRSLSTYKGMIIGFILALSVLGIVAGIMGWLRVGGDEPQAGLVQQPATAMIVADEPTATKDVAPVTATSPVIAAIASTATSTHTPTEIASPTSTTTATPANTITPTSTQTPQPTPSQTATAAPTPTPTTGLQLVADSRDDFSGSQGVSGWDYQWSIGRESFDWRPMRFDGSCWRTTNDEQDVRICQGSAHPGITGDITWRWTSTVNGPIQVWLSARKLDTGGGDGVIISAYKQTDLVKTWTLAGVDGQGFSEGLTIDATDGEYLFFVMKIGETSSFDETTFRAQIYR